MRDLAQGGGGGGIDLAESAARGGGPAVAFRVEITRGTS